MKRKFWVGASLSALVVAAMAPWSASQANGVSIRVNTPEFGIRIGAPHFPQPVFQPVPVYRPAPVYQPEPVYYPRYYDYTPPPVIYAPPPRYFAPPYLVGGYRGHGYYRHPWQQRHWQQPRWQEHHDGHGH